MAGKKKGSSKKSRAGVYGGDMKGMPIGQGFATMNVLGSKKTESRGKKGKIAKGGFASGF